MYSSFKIKGTTTVAVTSKAITITVNVPATPAVSIMASATTICAGAAVIFTATAINGGNNPNYQWMVNGLNSGTNNAVFSTNILNNGDVITCVLTSNITCAAVNTAASNGIAVIVNAVLVPAVNIVSSGETCAGMPVNFTVSAVNCGSNPRYNWQINGSSTGMSNAVFTSNKLMNGDVVSCLVTPDQRGCFTTTNAISNLITVKINSLPIVNAGKDTVVFKGSSFVLNGSANGSIAKYYWTPAIYLSNANIQNPVVTPLTTTKYTLHAISTANSEAAADITVKVFVKIVVPNTFTPNNDGVNDTWTIAGLADYPGATLDVYNRYGQLVLHSSAYKPWDGTLNGKLLPVATYYYVINPKSNMVLLSGWVALVR